MGTAWLIIMFAGLCAAISAVTNARPAPRPHITVAPHVIEAPGVCAALKQYDAIAATVTLNFYDRNFRGLPWTGLVRQYRNRVRCDDNPARVAMVANALLGRLHASHTGVYTADDLQYWALESIFSRSISDYPVAFSGIWPQRRGSTWFARYVLQGSPAYRAGARRGDELISVNGEPYRPLSFPAGTTTTLKISPDGKTERSIRLRPAIQSMQQFFLEATRASERIEMVGGARVGYFHLWAGTNPLFLRAWNAALTDFERHRVRAVILDLRGGYGGAGVQYLEKLRRDEYLRRIDKVVLIDRGTRSGKELLAGTIKLDHLATLVGSRTAGAFLGASPVRLFDNTYLVEVAVGNYVPPSIGPIEGIGIAPDVAVPACIRFCRGADPQLTRALQLIQRRLNR